MKNWTLLMWLQLFVVALMGLLAVKNIVSGDWLFLSLDVILGGANLYFLLEGHNELKEKIE